MSNAIVSCPADPPKLIGTLASAPTMVPAGHDDIYTASAGDAVGRALTARPGRVHIFRMQMGQHTYGGHGCVYDRGIGTPMFVVPNDGATGEWTTRRQGDFDFIASRLAKRRRPARFHEDAIAEIRPHEGPALVPS